MGARHVLSDKPPDVVLSGVNRGRNALRTCSISGTVAVAKRPAARHSVLATVAGAFRQQLSTIRIGQTAIKHAPDIIGRVLKQGIPRDVLVNINFPDCPPGAVKGVSVRRRASAIRASADRRAPDGRGNPYYWIAYERGSSQPEKTVRFAALIDNRVAVTPLRLDLTDQPFLDQACGIFP